MEDTRLKVSTIVPVTYNGVLIGNAKVTITSVVALDSQIEGDVKDAVIEILSKRMSTFFKEY